MKKVFVLCLLLACMLAGCGKGEQTSNQQQEEEEIYPYAEDLYYADTVNCGAITADTNGLLYTATYGDRTQEIKVYDLDGVCIEKAVLNASRGGASLMEASEGALYLMVPEVDCLYVLYEIDLETWQARQLYSFYGYTFMHLAT